MKKLFLMIANMCATFTLYAQYYAFTSGTQPYVETTDQELMDTSFTRYFAFLPDDRYKIFGKLTLDSFAAGTESGYLVASNNMYGFAMDPMMGTLIRKIDGKSKVTVNTVMEVNDKVLVVQWKDVGLYKHPDSDFLNFQVRLSLNTEKIRYHYGPSHFTPMPDDSAFFEPQNTGPEVLLVLLSADFSQLLDFSAVSGSRESPVYTTNYLRMTNIPNANQVFTFTKKTATGLNDVLNENNSVAVFPNPATTGMITITAVEEIEKITCRNVFGQEVPLTQNVISGKQIELFPDSAGQPLWVEITLVNGMSYVKRIHAGTH